MYNGMCNIPAGQDDIETNTALQSNATQHRRAYNVTRPRVRAIVRVHRKVAESHVGCDVRIQIVMQVKREDFHHACAWYHKHFIDKASPMRRHDHAVRHEQLKLRTE